MKIAFSRRALRQIEDIHKYIAANDVEAAGRVVERIRELCDALADFPGIGTMTDQPTVRALPLVRYPYVIFYSVLEATDEVRILRVRHTARRPAPPKGGDAG